MAGGVNVEIKDLLSLEIKDLPGEYWDEVPGLNDRYLISQYGRVKSVINGKEIILRKSLSSGKYKVILYNKRGRAICENVGRLCAKVHLRLPEENEVIQYIDGNVLNDQVNNLRWITKSESVRLHSSHMTRNIGVSHGMALINEIKAKEIRRLKSEGKTYRQLSAQYGVSIPCIQKIVERRTWKTV